MKQNIHNYLNLFLSFSLGVILQPSALIAQSKDFMPAVPSPSKIRVSEQNNVVKAG